MQLSFDQPRLLPPQEQPTPVTEVVHQGGTIWLKRDDLYEYAGVRGGKVRTCRWLCSWAKAQGYAGVVTAGSRQSPQVEIVAHVAKHLGLRARCHVPAGPDTPQLLSAAAQGAEIIRHRPGHNSVIVARARRDASDIGWPEIPFGMECEAAVSATATQVDNLPLDAKRIVVPVGSGMTLAGVTWGFSRTPYAEHVPVLGVLVGANPSKRLAKYAHPLAMRDVELVRSEHDYHHEVDATIGGVRLDPVYEAKCVPYLQPGDVFWLVGVRRAAA
jgi:1-aminocyclopropane-1-carboxylate deaminase/D-cysteine desulfhydrase-like pyridoxal-dependent ACC family enzyme